MVEVFRHSLFNLSYYFSIGNDYSINKPTPSTLRTNLMMLSIKTSDFVKYNMIYTVIKLLPFVLVTVLFNQDTVLFVGMLFMVVLFLLKAYTGPIHTMITSMKIELTLENKDLPRKERKEEYMLQLKEMYPTVNLKLFSVMFSLFVIGYLGYFVYGYTLVFPSLFGTLSYKSLEFITVFIVSTLILFIYGVYLNKLEGDRLNGLQ
jgi:hypothetical protein